MLRELQINDFAIIQHLHLVLEPGFTVMTGETGAGKSIIIDALGTLRGEKTTVSMVRAGCERARIEGVFTLSDSPGLVPALQAYGLWEEEHDDHIVLTREISAESGRSVARINRRVVNTSILRDIGGQLVDIHGQHEGVSLFVPRTHLDMLDRYGGLFPLREQVGSKVARLRQLRQELADLRQQAEHRQERIEELRDLLDDVTAAQLRDGEEQELVQERSVLHHAARIAELVNEAYTLLYTGDEHEPYPLRPITVALSDVVDNLTELARLDPTTTAMAEQSTDLLYHLEDLATSLRSYHDSFDLDPHRLEAIEDRLALIRTMQRKYGGDIAQILQQAASAEAEIERLSHSDEYMADLEAQEARLMAETGTLAGELSRRRSETGVELSRKVEAAMADLAMPHVRFAVQVEQTEDPTRGVPVQRADADTDTNTDDTSTSSSRYQVTSSGIDRVEFLLSPNPGEPLKPLVRIASGGESARLLLALKSILSHVDTVPTLVFDEIDIGVGGRVAQLVGQKLWAMSVNHQVLCITHMAQVAAFADNHYAISKAFVTSTDSGEMQTQTRLHHLHDTEQRDELAAMLDGVPLSEHSKASAQEMIERARSIKSGD